MVSAVEFGEGLDALASGTYDHHSKFKPFNQTARGTVSSLQWKDTWVLSYTTEAGTIGFHDRRAPEDKRDIEYTCTPQVRGGNTFGRRNMLYVVIHRAITQPCRLYTRTHT